MPRWLSTPIGLVSLLVVNALYLPFGVLPLNGIPDVSLGDLPILVVYGIPWLALLWLTFVVALRLFRSGTRGRPR